MISLARWPKVKELREKLNGKAKAQPEYRFYTLYDKVHRKDVLEAAYAHCRKNDGAPGVDGMSFRDIEAYGEERYLAELAKELKELRYHPQPVRRVMIPKEGKPGEFRPLGIPTIRDRTVQQAVKLLLDPIFEADFTDNAYAYREGKSAHDAVQAVDTGLRTRQVEVVDGDLSKYFDTIPHAELMRSVERRIADGKVLRLIRQWLKVPVHETNARGRTVISGGKKTKCGTPQGGVISPLLANIYFRRFLVAWEKLGLTDRFQSRVVNYADDFVILTRKHAREALSAARQIFQKIGLTLNERKTRTVRAWQDSFNFLGYRFGKLYARQGREYLGCTPSDQSVRKYREKIHQLTARNQTCKRVEDFVAALNHTTRGFWNYFRRGTVSTVCHALDEYLWERVMKWARCKYKRARCKKTPGQAARKARIQGALKKVVRGRDLCQMRNGGPLFASAACYAQ